MPNLALLRDVASILRTRPEGYNPATRDGPPFGDCRYGNYDIIGHVLEALLCVRKIHCPSSGVVCWIDVDGLRVVQPNKLALNAVGLPAYVTRNWYKSNWNPPPQYGEGALAVADYLEALVDEFEFYEMAEL